MFLLFSLDSLKAIRDVSDRDALGMRVVYGSGRVSILAIRHPSQHPFTFSPKIRYE